MDKLNAAILEAYEGYHTALDCVKGWKQEAAHPPAEDQEAEVEQAPAEDHQDPEEEATAGEDQEVPTDV